MWNTVSGNLVIGHMVIGLVIGLVIGHLVIGLVIGLQVRLGDRATSETSDKPLHLPHWAGARRIWAKT